MRNGIRRAGGALLLGMATFGINGFAGSWFAKSGGVETITDWVSLPALLIAGIFYSEGLHTEDGAVFWVAAFWGAGIVFYAAIWFCVLCLVSLAARRRKAA